MKKMKFSTGQVVWTRYINDCITDSAPFAEFVMESLKRHCAGDWGELDVEDKRANDLALQEGGRLFSAYIKKGPKIWKVWIITEADRSVTTVLFPKEY
jgi:hypothetical protein